MEQVYGVGQFAAEYCGDLVEYYSGNTTNGRYEDASGDAYLVKYDSNGKVILLYQGMFSKGTMNDNTEYAWSIVWDENSYVHWTGYFEDGHSYR